jgi:hypothetical protein
MILNGLLLFFQSTQFMKDLATLREVLKDKTAEEGLAFFAGAYANWSNCFNSEVFY